MEGKQKTKGTGKEMDSGYFFDILDSFPTRSATTDFSRGAYPTKGSADKDGTNAARF